jgi:uncharacterized protein YkwD
MNLQFGGGHGGRLVRRASKRQELGQKIVNPRALMQLGLGLGCFCLASFGVLSQTPSQAQSLGEDPKLAQERVSALPEQYRSRSVAELRAYALELVNKDRQAKGLAPLVPDPIADRSAQFHAEDMMRRQFYDHYTPEGLKPRHRYRNQGGANVSLIGENLFLVEDPRRPGLNFELATFLQQGWMNSPDHREAILMRQFSGFGYGIVFTPGGKIYAVQVFTTAPSDTARAAK